MFPRELWQIIYHYSHYTTLENLLINKQFYEELSDCRFWLIYTKNKLIKNVEYTKVSDWIKELKYIKYINGEINQLNKSSNFCQYIVKKGKRKGLICGYINCNHADIDRCINKGRILFHLKHVDMTEIDYLKKYLFLPLNSKLFIYKDRSVSIEYKCQQLYFNVLDKHDFKILIYQMFLF